MAIRRRLLAAALLAVLFAGLLAGCGNSDPATPPESTTAPQGTPLLAPLERAQDVADQVDRREADLEAVLDGLEP
jgi:hypothetical protein